MGVKISVVIPVYNAGRYLDGCIDSVLDQSMPAGDYEVIFVDDGSDDGSAGRIDSAAAGRDHVQVIHISHTGGPGGPRNLGMDIANGEYIYFLDDHDRLEPEALARMYAMAERNGAEIVIGRVVGHGHEVPASIFRSSRDVADILRDGLLELPTVHKLFSAAFLRDHVIRFSEGRTSLEDQRFCVRAYFRARVVSVLSDYVCCHWIKRTDLRPEVFEPRWYFAAVAEILDVVDEHVEPGEIRNRFHAHWFQHMMLSKLSGASFLALSAERRRELLTSIRELALDRFDPGVDRWIPRPMRPRAALLRAGGHDDLVRLARAEHGITVRPVLEDLRWEGETLVVALSADLTYADGAPVVVRRTAGRARWEPPASLVTPVPADALDVTGTLPESGLEVLARHRESGADVVLPIHFDRVPGDTLAFAGQARLDGAALDSGAWDIVVKITACGWRAAGRVGANRTERAAQSCVGGFVGDDPRLVVPYWAESGNLSVRVAPESLPHIVAAAAPAASLRTSVRRMWLDVPVPFVPREPVTLRLRRRGPLAGDVVVPAGFAVAEPDRAGYGPARPGEPHGRLVATIPTGRRHVGRGTWTVELRSGDRAARLGMFLDVAARGEVRLRISDEAVRPSVHMTALRRLVRRVPALRGFARTVRRFGIATSH